MLQDALSRAAAKRTTGLSMCCRSAILSTLTAKRKCPSDDRGSYPGRGLSRRVFGAIQESVGRTASIQFQPVHPSNLPTAWSQLYGGLCTVRFSIAFNRQSSRLRGSSWFRLLHSGYRLRQLQKLSGRLDLVEPPGCAVVHESANAVLHGHVRAG